MDGRMECGQFLWDGKAIAVISIGKTSNSPVLTMSGAFEDPVPI